MTVRVVVADDHPMYRYGLRSVLDASPEVDVVGEAEDGAQLLALVARTAPDVVLTDLSMPQLSGIAAIDELTRRRPGLGVLVLTMHEDDASLFGALRAGARGYLLKGAGRAEILRSVRAVAEGEAIFGAGIAARLTAFFAAAPAGPTTPPFPELTAREREVLDLVARGMSNPQIATQLQVSGKTVRNHVSNVFTKLQVADRAAAAALALRSGLGGGS